MSLPHAVSLVEGEETVGDPFIGLCPERLKSRLIGLNRVREEVEGLIETRERSMESSAQFSSLSILCSLAQAMQKALPDLDTRRSFLEKFEGLGVSRGYLKHIQRGLDPFRSSAASEVCAR